MKLSAAPGELWSVVVEEWRTRTVFGKALYPFWLVFSALEWITFLSFILILAVAGQLVAVFDEDSSIDRVLPKVYKDE